MRRHLNRVNIDRVVSWSLLAAVASLLGPVFGQASRRAADATRPHNEPNVITICDLFGELRSHQGKIVAVRGIYYFGLRQPGCPSSFSSPGRLWPTALDLIGSELMVDGALPTTFNTDESAWDRLDEAAIALGKSGKHAELWVTVVGELRGPQRYQGGKAAGVGGFGHLGTFPAELVVWRVSDIQVKQRPTYDYRTMLPPRLHPTKPAR